jgi:hypothetical protein
MDKISHNTTLDDYILNFELSNLLGISSNAYRFWKDVRAVKYDESRVVYLKKSSIPKRYRAYISKCTDLSGFVQAQAFCKYTGLASSHLTKSNNSKIYEIFDILQIKSVKLVNLKKFYDYIGLEYSYHIYIEKCRYFGPFPLEKKIKLAGGMCVGYY